MKIAIFVLADMFVPLMLSTGKSLERQGHQVRYLNFLPHDHKLLSKNTDQLYPRNLETLDGAAQAQEVLFSQDTVQEMVNFMQMKHGGSLTEWHDRVNTVAPSVAACYLSAFLGLKKNPDVSIVPDDQRLITLFPV